MNADVPPPRRFRILPRRISFATIATFGLGIFVALAVGITLYMSGAAGVRSTQALLAEQAEVLLDDIERRIDAKLQPVSDQADWIVRAIAEGRVDLEKVDRLDAFMFGTLGTTPQLRAVAIISPAGSVRRWARGERTAAVDDWSARPNLAALLEDEQTQSGPHWRPPLRSTMMRTAVLQHAAPLRVDGRFVGMLSQVVPAFVLSEALADFDRESGVTPFILYGKDRVLAHPGLSGNEIQSIDSPLPDIESLGDNVLKRIHTPDVTNPFGMRTLSSAKAVAALVDGEKYVYLYRELTRFGPEAMTVGVYINVDRSGHALPMKRVMKSLLAGLAVLVLAVLFAATMGQRLSRPLRALAQAATAAHDGKLDEVPRLPGSMIREYDGAARSFNTMVEGLRERALIRNTLGQFVPEEVARRLLAGKGELEPVEVKATALICDIEEFTQLTDTLGPRGVVEFLNAYFEVMAAIIERHGGVITQFQGDAVLAVFNVPVADRNHAAHALSAAIEMVRTCDQLEFAGVRVRNRVGISTGRLLSGAIGSRGRRTYTVHGSTVNLASRLEVLNKEYGTRILLSGKTAERCPEFELRKVADVHVRGYGDVVELYAPETH